MAYSYMSNASFFRLLILPALVAIALLFLFGAITLKDTSPGQAGDAISDLSQSEYSYFLAGKQRFQEINNVTGTSPGSASGGLGPRFNSVSCGGCHAYPAVGGSSPPLNPQVAAAAAYGARNKVPSFIIADGPVREVRFRFNPDRTRDGGVHNLFVISGRSDAGSCNISQPDFEKEQKENNLSFRIPTPVFGAGLIEAISDTAILENQNSDLDLKKTLGISGHANHARIENVSGSPNRSANDGTITKFGWKAQNKSLLIFAGEAYNVEQGVTNEVFPNERDNTPGCALNSLPEDHTNFEANNSVDLLSDIAAFANFMRFLAPPQPKPSTPSSENGKILFSTIGCTMCHTPALKTGFATTESLRHKTVNLYSDLLLHHMGPNLADDIVQGDAGPDEFRTAPLWGVGSRLFYLHDGRTNDLETAILEHASTHSKCTKGQGYAPDAVACASEANRVVENFNELSKKEKAELLEFLNTL